MFKIKSYAIYLMTSLVGLATVCVYALSAPLFDVAAVEQSLGRSDLWRVVTYLCVPSARVGVAFPCAEVHLGDQGVGGWATLRVGTAHILTIPTDRVPGIESPAVQMPKSARYWQAAWDARSLVEADIGRNLPRDAIGLAVNSAFSRTQDQFHIHTACIKPAVRAALASEHGRIGPQWIRLHTPLNGINYMARRLDVAHLGDQNVVGLLPDPVKASEMAMARQALVVVGATFDDGTEGYYVLNTQATGSRSGDGEALLDFSCRTL